MALDTTRDVNNGQPGTLAHWIDALDLKTGDRVFHLGCGVGYFTAIMAGVVGAGGSVVACELDPVLAGRAGENLASYPNVAVHAGDGAAFDPGACDAMLHQRRGHAPACAHSCTSVRDPQLEPLLGKARRQGRCSD